MIWKRIFSQIKLFCVSTVNMEFVGLISCYKHQGECVKNSTKKQHYISRVEQGLNTSTPNSKKENKKIYAHKIVDREECTVNLTNSKGVKIETNLVDKDIYSFDILSEGQRLNFEDVFGRYESKVGKLTRQIEQNLVLQFGLNEDVLDVFLCKMLNVVRNPYCIKSTLYMLKSFKHMKPSNIELKLLFDKIETGNNKHFSHVARKYNVTTEEYKSWLKMLFLVLVVPFDNTSNLLESIVTGLFKEDFNSASAYIFNYDPPNSPALSDRGYAFLFDGESAIFQFNLNKSMFLAISFTNLVEMIKSTRPNLLANNKIMGHLNSTVCQEFQTKVIPHNLDYLKAYNRTVVRGSYSMIFSSTPVLYGL